MKRHVLRLLRDRSGAIAIEYGLIAGLLSIVIVTSLQTVGTSLNTKFTNVAAALN